MQGRYITNPAVTGLLDGLYRPLSPALAAFREAAEAEGLPIILRDTERLLTALLRLKRPARILEIGTSVGYSACCFAAVCGRDTAIVTLERDAETAARAEANFRRLGFAEQIQVITGDARETAQQVPGPLDFVFIDAGKSHYRAYWDGVIGRCAEGAVIVCDNVLMRGAVADEQYDTAPRRHRTSLRRMRAFLEYITETDCAETAVLAAGDGLAVSVIHRGSEDEED